MQDLEERKIDDPLAQNNDPISHPMSVQALLQRRIGESESITQALARNPTGMQTAAATQSSAPHGLLSSGTRTNTALQMLAQETARSTLPLLSRTSEYAPGLFYQNVANTSGLALSGSLRPSPLPAVANHSSGLSTLMTNHLRSSANLLNYQRSLGAAYTDNVAGLSSLVSNQVLSRASAINYQRSLEQAIIRENESAQRIHQLQLSQNAHEVLRGLYHSAVMRDGANLNPSALQSNRNHAFIHDRSHPLSQAAINTTIRTQPVEVNDPVQSFAAAMTATLGRTDLSQSVSGLTVDGNAAGNQRHNSGGILLATEDDERNLSEYQSLVRHQLEFFEADEDDVSLTTQGRKKTVFIGQVGIRCKHCAHRPASLRSRGSVYFPSRLSSVYQAAQNMAVSHLMDACDEIEQTIRDQLCSLRLRKDTAAGGKAYWASSCEKVGVYETETGLRLTPKSAA